MKRMAALVVVFSAMAVTADDKKIDTAKLVGLWKSTKSDSGAPPGATVEFTKDGKVNVAFEAGGKKEMFSGKYTAKDGKLSVELKIGTEEIKESNTIKELTDKKLVLVDKDGKSDEFERVADKK